MYLKPGDKVRYLNEAIEGIIVRLLPNGRAEVETKDGFNQIAMLSQLVKEEFVVEEIGEEEIYSADEKGMEQINSTRSKQSFIEYLKADEKVYAGITLLHPTSPYSSDVDIFIVNNTNYHIAFSFAKRGTDKYLNAKGNVLLPSAESHVGVFSQDEIHQTSGFVIQLLFFSEHAYRPIQPVEKVLQFSSADFVSDKLWEMQSSMPAGYFMTPLFSLLKNDEEQDIGKLLDKFNYKQADFEQKRLAGKGKSSKFTMLVREKTVDLHIEELMKDSSQMSASQIFAYQMNIFEHEMDQAIINHLQRITFIHGKGNFVLKASIKEELKKYSSAWIEENLDDNHGKMVVVFK